MPDFRTPRGFGRTDWPFISRFKDGTTPGYALRPLSCLPVWALDKRRDDAIVIPPGTFVGRVNSRDHVVGGSNIDSSFIPAGAGSSDPVAPAGPVAYTLTYGSNDLADAFDDGSWTPDIDVDASTAVASAGASTKTLLVKPLGITGRPYYAGYIADRFQNYDPDLGQAWISGLHIVRIPCLTADEMAIEAGDLVKLNDTATPSWNPADLTNSLPGRVHAYDGGALADMEYVVGRCTNKIRIAKQSSTSAGQTLRTAIGTGAPRTLTNIDTTRSILWPVNENFEVQNTTEGVPGLGLSGTSATLGRPSELLWARADANGDFWAIDILLRV